MKNVIACLCVFICALLYSQPSHAKGVFIFNHGDELFEVAPFPTDLASQFPDAKNYKVGYKCSHVGLFWADAWTWDCKMVAANVEAKSYGDLPADVVSQLQAKPEFAFDKSQRSFWNHYGFILLALGLLAIVIYGKVSNKADEQAAAA